MTFDPNTDSDPEFDGLEPDSDDVTYDGGDFDPDYPDLSQYDDDPNPYEGTYSEE